jgi:hypothetical protein
MRFKAMVLAAVMASGGARAQTAPIPGWDGFVAGLRDLAPAMVARLPARLRGDAQVRAELGRLMLEALATCALSAISADGDHPVFLPGPDVTLNVFQPNADTTYRTAFITPGGTYRLRGQAGSLRITKIGEVLSSPQDGGKLSAMLAYHDIGALRRDAAGRFDVVLSPRRPAGYGGDWWRLDPRATMLLLRQVDYDWGRERDPTISIERLDAPVQRTRPSAAALQARLEKLTAATAATALAFVDHVEGLRRGGFLNRLHVFDVSQMGGLVGQFYYEGAYELKPDEALLVATTVPKGCVYSSILLTNDIYETTDWYNNESSLNGSQVRVDRDGVLRVVVAGRDPGVPNWLDTAGYDSGAVQGRWTGCASTPVPSARVVKLAELRRYLPEDTPVVTPPAREALVRARRAALQQRPLW